MSSGAKSYVTSALGMPTVGPEPVPSLYSLNSSFSRSSNGVGSCLSFSTELSYLSHLLP
jgi:hypothetical protein